MLFELRKPRFKTQSDLASALSGRKVKGTISRGYVSALESGAKKPSLELLRELCWTLVLAENQAPTHQQLSQVTDLVFAALDLELPKPYDALSLDDELQKQGKEWVRSVWIISGEIGENLFPRILDATVANLQRQQPTKYTYFVSDRDEWDRCQRALQERVGRSKVRAAVTAVLSPALMCVPRVRILNPGDDVELGKCEGTVTIGPRDHLGMYRLQASQIETICLRLGRVLETLETSDKAEVPDGTFTRLFPGA